MSGEVQRLLQHILTATIGPLIFASTNSDSCLLMHRSRLRSTADTLPLAVEDASGTQRQIRAIRVRLRCAVAMCEEADDEVCRLKVENYIANSLVKQYAVDAQRMDAQLERANGAIKFCRQIFSGTSGTRNA